MTRTVLIVDDDPDLRLLLNLCLDRPGESKVVADAEDGRVAVAAAREHQPDVIVLDEMMPICSGSEAIPMLRSVAPRARIVLYSAVAVDAVTIKASEAPADAYVRKGERLEILVAAVLG